MGLTVDLLVSGLVLLCGDESLDRRLGVTGGAVRTCPENDGFARLIVVDAEPKCSDPENCLPQVEDVCGHRLYRDHVAHLSISTASTDDLWLHAGISATRPTARPEAAVVKVSDLVELAKSETEDDPNSCKALRWEFDRSAPSAKESPDYHMNRWSAGWVPSFATAAHPYGQGLKAENLTATAGQRVAAQNHLVLTLGHLLSLREINQGSVAIGLQSEKERRASVAAEFQFSSGFWASSSIAKYPSSLSAPSQIEWKLTNPIGPTVVRNQGALWLYRDLGVVRSEARAQWPSYSTIPDEGHIAERIFARFEADSSATLVGCGVKLLEISADAKVHLNNHSVLPGSGSYDADHTLWYTRVMKTESNGVSGEKKPMGDDCRRQVSTVRFPKQDATSLGGRWFCPSGGGQ